MENISIPIFRAEELGSGKYIEGYYYQGNDYLHKHESCGGTNTEFTYDGDDYGKIICYDCEEIGEQYNKDRNLNTFHSVFHKKAHYLSRLDGELGSYEINPNTLSIHFHNMVDKRGNKIFCSLNASGKGGDICESEYYTRTAIYRDGMFYLKDGHILAEELFQEILVIGVQR